MTGGRIMYHIEQRQVFDSVEQPIQQHDDDRERGATYRLRLIVNTSTRKRIGSGQVNP